MRIGEVARSAGVTTSRIRFYEEEGLLPAAERAANGYRVYTERTAKIVSFIERAQRFGFSLREIGEFLNSPARLNPSRGNLLPVLETKLKEMDKHLREARQRRNELKAFIDALEGGVPPTIRPVPGKQKAVGSKPRGV